MAPRANCCPTAHARGLLGRDADERSRSARWPVIRKGAASAVVNTWRKGSAAGAAGSLSTVEQVSLKGATPLVVAVGARILGVIALSDVLKSGIRDRMLRMREMGIRTVMVTGDNPVTAAAIASKPAWTISWPRPSPNKS